MIGRILAKVGLTIVIIPFFLIYSGIIYFLYTFVLEGAFVYLLNENKFFNSIHSVLWESKYSEIANFVISCVCGIAITVGKFMGGNSDYR